MITKEQKINKYCCLYVSDFHLEMILLPFIKNKIKESKILIYTQSDLLGTLKVLLTRTNLSYENKRNILKIENWNNKIYKNINHEDTSEYTVIINGNDEYRKMIKKGLKNLNIKNIVDCYNLNDSNIQKNKIKNKYNGILNTGII